MDREDVRKAFQRDLGSDAFRQVLKDIWTEKGFDESEIEYPVEIHPCIKAAPQQFPCGEIALSIGRVDTPDQPNAEYNFQITVFWHANGSDEEQLEDVLDRLVRATQDFYKGKPIVQTVMGGFNVWLGDNDASPLIEWGQDARPYVKSMAQELFAKVIR